VRGGRLLIGVLIGQAIHGSPADRKVVNPNITRTPSMADKMAADANASEAGASPSGRY